MFDRGLYVSFATCGLPYYVGNIIADERTKQLGRTQGVRLRSGVLSKSGLYAGCYPLSIN